MFWVGKCVKEGLVLGGGERFGYHSREMGDSEVGQAQGLNGVLWRGNR